MEPPSPSPPTSGMYVQLWLFSDLLINNWHNKCELCHACSLVSHYLKVCSCLLQFCRLFLQAADFQSECVAAIVCQPADHALHPQMTGVYTELENVYAEKNMSPLHGGSSAEPEVPGQIEAYGRCLSPLTLPPLAGTAEGRHTPEHSATCIHMMCTCFHQWSTAMCH